MLDTITVIICTYNRGHSLKDTLNSLSTLRCPEAIRLEVIVVDNNSTDSTKETIRKFIECGPCNIKYLFEQRQGLSFARNAGLEVAKGDVIIFTDDDVIVDSNWLTEIANTFVEYDADCVGGKILPVWPGERPSWLSRNNENILALLDYGECVLELSIDDPPLFGANIAFSRRILNKTGNFSTSLGRTGNKLYGGEDTDMYSRVFQANGKIIYQPKAVVNHVISATRLNKSYFRRWHYDTGECSGRSLGNYDRRNFLGIPFYVIREFIVNTYKYMATLMSFKINTNFYYELKLIYYIGYMLSRISMRFNP